LGDERVLRFGVLDLGWAAFRLFTGDAGCSLTTVLAPIVTMAHHGECADRLH
jgi:hypothetical protein